MTTSGAPATSKPMGMGARVRFALKPGSWPKILAPAFVGQVMGVTAAGRIDGAAVLLGAAYTAALLIFIVLMNDWGDAAVDTIKRRMFPEGCSPKTIPDGILSAQAVLRGGLIAGAVAVGVALLSGVALGRWIPAALGVGGVLLFVAYTLPPLRLNYRGGGEFLEMIGVGAVLPLWNLMVHAGTPPRGAPWAFAAMMLGALSSAVASGLSDEESDRAGGKRTFATVLGNARARLLVELSLGLAALTFLAGARIVGSAALVVAGARTVLGTVRVVLASKRAVTNAFHDLTRYKSELHAALWGSWIWLAMVIIAEKAVRGSAAPW